ncbi:glycosyltransferase family 2 protein [candidate division WOR-3 bacterium]|uniref:Glycosyltransferase family 2 protein n=1 Tax=candidate division WOR-3 bacterium TaxID=2052148 RepID=A0A660SMP0_UNCW3|nr:MAG: glycosyltransferase family 2 protein [candidate division WOR-3 bacterium]
MGAGDKEVDLSIIIPVYNEEDSIRSVLERVKELPIEKEIIVVDDCSRDRTYEILKEIDGIRLIRHEQNRGKGAAIRTGLTHAKGRFTIIQDADLEYPVEVIPKLLIRGSDIVYGSRMLGRSRFLFLSYWANRLLSLLTSLLYNHRITDMETCYKLIRTDLLKALKLKANRFDIEPEITAKLLRSGHRITEIPIDYIGRKRGKKIGVKDGISAILTLLRYRIFR